MWLALTGRSDFILIAFMTPSAQSLTALRVSRYPMTLSRTWSLAPQPHSPITRRSPGPRDGDVIQGTADCASFGGRWIMMSRLPGVRRTSCSSPPGQRTQTPIGSSRSPMTWTGPFCAQ